MPRVASVLLPHYRPARRLMIAGALGLTGALFPLVGADDKPPSGPVIELPAMVVTDSRELPPPEAWRYAEIPGIEILSNASDRDTQRLIMDFEQFRRAMEVVWPGVQPKSAMPISLILCGRKGKFDDFVSAAGGRKTRSDEIVPRLITGEETVSLVVETPPTAEEQRTDVGRASMFLKGQEHAAIILDLEQKTLNLGSLDAPAVPAGDDESIVGGNSDFQIDHYQQLYREYIRYVLSGARPRAPAWLEEGLAQLFMTMKFDRKSIVFAKIEDPNLQSLPGVGQEDSDFNKALQRRGLIPLQEFFAVEHDSATALNPLGSTWSKQAQAFVHMCLYGRNQRFQKSFVAFVLRTQNEPVTEALFKECFKMSYGQMLVELRGYADFTDYKSIEFRAPKGKSLPPPEPLVLRDATEAEVGRIKGEALMLVGNIPAARTALIAPYIRGARDPRLLAALGMEELAAGREDRARKFLEAVAQVGMTRPRAYLELARLRYAEVQAKPAGPKGLLSADQAAGVLTPLFTARAQPPAMPEVYELIADVWTKAAVGPTRENLAVLEEGVKHFPRDAGLVYQTAALDAQAGRVNESAALVALGLRVAPDAETKAKFERLQAAFTPPGSP